MSRATLIKLLRRLGFLLLTLLAIKTCLPERAILAPADLASQERKLIVIPTDGIPTLFLTSMRSRLKEQHGFEVLIAVQMALDSGWVINPDGQLDADQTAVQGLELCRRMSTNNEYCVVLTNRDINTKNSGLRYLFAQHHKGISVVSLARLSDANYGVQLNLLSVPIIFEKTLDRATKMINKGVGLGYYSYALSTDKRSVMYAPIMSLADLDSVGTWYLDTEIRQKNYQP